MAEGHACMLPMPDAATFLNGLEDLYRTSSRKPKMILVSFPHNPTTICVDIDYLREIVRLAVIFRIQNVEDFARRLVPQDFHKFFGVDCSTPRDALS